ncbi:protein MTSS 1 [Caerostris darwini]|uniref:Protein MTSS 1 n=1 Tax=Caerostris darwini TaxID=1538125 RepID=A0AAV4MJW0_9ARAC|nr:protein MTSS 1 [Caerostris darwini]
MEPAVEREFTALGGLFQHIISDLKNSAPVWEDFLFKAGKFHAQLRSTILASTSFLDSFQKVADMATNTRGATKEIGSALTRLCLRQRSVEAKLQIFANTLLEGLLTPLQEKVEEWKKTCSNLDKEHSKEYKRAKQDLKKKSSDTLKLQKKVRKVGVIDIRRTLDYALQDVTDKYLLLEEIEKQSVRKALIEERSHFCLFVGYLQPVLESEITMLHEINHIQEIIDTLSKITGDPHVLPSASEQVITDVKKSENTWNFHETPPGSPRSLGSRKSSVCSISSINSSSSGSLKSHSSRHLSHSQVQTLGRKHLNSVASQDSGFTSQDTLFYNNMTVAAEYSQLSTFQESSTATFSTPSSPVPPVTSTWPNLQEPDSPEKESSNLLTKYQRPHTISSAYEKSNHNRPALTVHTFLPLDQNSDLRNNYATVGTFKSFGSKFKDRNCTSQPGTPVYSRPTLPERNDYSYRPKPSLPEKSASVKAKHDKLYSEPNKSVPDFNRTPPDQVVPHPIYANASDLASKKSLSDEIYSPRLENNTEVQNRKEFAAVLNEGLLMQSKWIRSEKSFSESESSSPAVPKHGRLAGGSSETLPRSRGSLTEEQILEWQIQSLSNDINMLNQQVNQRRPMSIAGISPGFMLPRKANTLQRVGSSAGPKPPTPVRRSSSITSSASQGKISEEVKLNKSDKSPLSMSSGAGETRYSPTLREFKRSYSALSSPQEKFGYSLRHVEINNLSERSNSNSSLNKESGTNSENSIVTDVSDSRARLIHDLNSTLSQQRKNTLKKQASQGDPPIVPPRNTSKHEQNGSKLSNRFTVAENALYGHCSRKEKTHTFNAKPVHSQDLQKQFPQKPHLKECLSQGDLFHCSKDWDQPFKQKNGNDLPDNDRLLKKSFVAALNAKLAEHQRIESEADDKPHIAPWLKNDKNYLTWNSGFRRLAPQLSLMDQIKQGTRLRRVTSNDRSSPRFA